jgi:hypothetical protein
LKEVLIVATDEFYQMMRTKTKTEIIFETWQRTTIRWRRQRLDWCERCAAQVWMLAPDEAATLAQTTARAIFRRVEAGELHFLETAGGALLVCRASLELTQKKQEQPNEHH